MWLLKICVEAVMLQRTTYASPSYQDIASEVRKNGKELEYKRKGQRWTER